MLDKNITARTATAVTVVFINDHRLNLKYISETSENSDAIAFKIKNGRIAIVNKNNVAYILTGDKQK